MLAVISLGWENRDLIRKGELDRERWEQLRIRVPQIGLPAPDDDSGKEGWYGINHAIVDDEELELITAAGFKPHLTRVKGLRYSAPHGTSPRELLKAHTTVVSVPNVGLLSVAKVTWLENACTELVQEALNAGWRILAVCPPNDQRRPDYILGHTDPGASERF